MTDGDGRWVKVYVFHVGSEALYIPSGYEKAGQDAPESDRNCDGAISGHFWAV
jgi:hypothetical protein